MTNFKNLISGLLATSFTLLSACTTSTIESSVLTPQNPNCSASTYDEIILDQKSQLNSGRDRDQIVSTLSEMAVEISKIDPLPERTCQVEYSIDFRSHARPIYGVEIESPVTISILTGNNRLCLNHTDLDGPDRYGIRVDDSEIKYPWKWVDQGPSVDGLPDGYFARRAYVPVCFNRNGEIEGYLNG